MRKLIRRPSPALVVACLALFMAGTGTGVAVIKALPAGSVGTVQLKANAVVSSKVKNHSLTAADFATGLLSSGLTGTITIVGTATPIAAGGVAGTAVANCPPSYVAIGGGVDTVESSGAWWTLIVTASGPTIEGGPFLALSAGQHEAATGWYATAHNPQPMTTYNLSVAVICAPTD